MQACDTPENGVQGHVQGLVDVFFPDCKLIRVLHRIDEGQVLLATDGAGASVVIKVCQKSLRSAWRLKQELVAMQMIAGAPEDAFLVKVLEAKEERGIVAFLMPYYEHGDLLEWVTKGEPFAEQEARRLFRQMASAVRYLHTLGVAHLDISMENIVLDRAKNARLLDFGLACTFPPGKPLIVPPNSRAHGKPNYMAPERFHQQRHDVCACDVWSLGVALYCMVTGRIPFQTLDATDRW